MPGGNGKRFFFFNVIHVLYCFSRGLKQFLLSLVIEENSHYTEPEEALNFIILSGAYLIAE